jgi:hypothetical protein
VEERNGRIETIEKATTSLKSKLLKVCEKFSNILCHDSRAEWFECYENQINYS